MRYAEPIAYRIGFKPPEFPRLTPLEFYRYLEASDERRRLQDYRVAYFISWLMSPVMCSYIREFKDHSKEKIFNLPEEIIYKEDKVKNEKKEMEYLKKVFNLEGGA